MNINTTHNDVNNDNNNDNYLNFIKKFNKLVCSSEDGDEAFLLMYILDIESLDELFHSYCSHRKQEIMRTIVSFVEHNNCIEPYNGDLSFLSDFKKNISEYLTYFITSNKELSSSVKFDSIDDIIIIFNFLKDPPYPLIKIYNSVESFEKDFFELMIETPKVNNFNYIIEIYHQCESFCSNECIDTCSLFLFYTENKKGSDGLTGREHIVREFLRLYTKMRLFNLPTETKGFVKEFIDIKTKYDSSEIQSVKDSYEKQILDIKITSLSELLHLKRSLNNF